MSAKKTATVGRQLKTLCGDMPQENIAYAARVTASSLSNVINDNVSPTVASVMKILAVTGGSITLDSGKAPLFTE